MSESAAPVGPGDVLAGKYKVERVLGVGGMGVVVQALHLELDERVAVKFLLPKAIESPEAATRFVREARAAVRIKSEHVVRVSDVGRLDDGAPYIVMEFLEGKDLSALVDEGAFAVEDAVDYVLQACEAMAEAHRLGIVHRDLKPSNLFLTRRSDGSPVVKVLDFGISKVTANDTGDAGLTKTATPMGSPYYMSPEQLRSAKDVDRRTDIWALGVILFELFTLMPPFQAETMPQLVAAILSEPPMALDKLAPSLPEELRAVVARCLEKDRALRYPDIAALALALAPFAPARSRHLVDRLTHGVVSEKPLPDRASRTQVSVPPSPEAPTRLGEELAAGTNTAWIGTHGEKAGTNRKLLLAAGGGLVALAAALAFAFGRPHTDDAPAASSAAPLTGLTDKPGAALPIVVPEPDTVARASGEASVPPVVSVAPSVVPVPPVEPMGPASSTAVVAGTVPRSATRAPKPTVTSATASKTPAAPAPSPVAAPPAAAPSPPAGAAAPPETPKPRKNPLAVDLK